MNDKCRICQNRAVTQIECLILARGTLGFNSVVKMLERSNVFTEEEDLQYHATVCMKNAETATGAHKTLHEMKRCAAETLAAKRASAKAEMNRQCLPYGHPDVNVIKAAGDANRLYLDLKEKGVQLARKYELQVEAIDAKKKLREVLERNAAQDAKRTAAMETQRLAMEYQAAEQRKIEAAV